MKVLHVVPSVGPFRGGPSFSVPAMARGLAQAGVEVHLATTDDNGPTHLDVPLGQPVVQDDVTYWYFRRQTSFYAASWPMTRWLARHVSDYDLLHIHALFTYAPLPATLFAHRNHVPYVLRPLGTLNRWGMQQRRPWLKRISFQLFEQHMLARAGTIHFTSEQERSEAEELGRYSHNAVIPLGIDLTPFEHLPDPHALKRLYPALAEKTVILFLSRLDPKKGLDLLLPAFAHVRRSHPDAALVLAGSGTPEYEAIIRAQVQALEIEPDVLFTGFLSGDQKLAVLAGSDLFVLPSYSENFGLAVVEAMASGLPVVISDQIGIADEIGRAGAGLVTTCQESTLADALLRLVADTPLRHNFATRAHCLARQRFSVEAMTRSLLHIYADLAIGPREICAL